MAIAQKELEAGYTVPELSLGDRLKLARLKAGLTREDMAQSLGVSVTGVGHWETGHAKPKDVLATIDRWAELTQTPKAWLLNIMYTSSCPGQDPFLTEIRGESMTDSLPRQQARGRHPSAAAVA